jgi:hypothetical protein
VQIRFSRSISDAKIHQSRLLTNGVRHYNNKSTLTERLNMSRDLYGSLEIIDQSILQHTYTMDMIFDGK